MDTKHIRDEVVTPSITPEDKKRILRRLKKILALSESSNPGEAAAALHQANLLMQKYGMSQVDAEISSVEESETTLSSAEISKWEQALFGVVAASLGVSAFISGYSKIKGLRRPRGKIIFVGEGYRSKVAVYAFETLRRKLRKDLKESFDAILTQAGINDGDKKLVKVTSSQRDAYAFSWCHAVRGKVAGLAPEVPATVKLYLETRIGSPTNHDAPPQKPKAEKPLDALAGYLASKGLRDGKAVELHKAVHSHGLAVKEIGYESAH